MRNIKLDTKTREREKKHGDLFVLTGKTTSDYAKVANAPLSVRELDN